MVYGQLVEIDGTEMKCTHQPEAVPVLERVLELYPPLCEGEWAFGAARVLVDQAGGLLLSYTADSSPEPDKGVTE